MVDEDLDEKVDSLYRQEWLKNHPLYYKIYRKKHKHKLTKQQHQWLKRNREHRKIYMRDHMRKYRKQKNVNNKTDIPCD